MKLALAALALFVISLPLPAADVQVFQSPSPVEGWRAAAMAIAFLPDDLRGGHFANVIVALASVANLSFLFGPWLVMPTRSLRAARVGFAAAVLGAVFAAASPLALGGEYSPHLRPGFFVWVLAYAILLAALGWRIKTLAAVAPAAAPPAPEPTAHQS